MLFVELRFFLVFGLAFAIYWSLRSDRHRKLWLLAVSYFVYGSWDWRYLLLVLASTVVDWFAGQGAQEGRAHRKLWVTLSLVANLGMLGFFKYYNFFVESGSELLRWLGLEVSDYTLQLILPIGISFYTFQTLSYTIDIYRGRLAPSRHFTDLALFVAFFPQLVAGPIVRAVQFMPQLESPRRFAEHVDVRGSLAIFLFGFVKKTVVSDHVSPLVDLVYADAGSYDTASMWLASFLFDVQIYCDFSGYSDMAIGVAGLLGYKLPRNFFFPYFARSLTSLWQRWHMTLGAWFTDYIYYPLGGSKKSDLRTRFNLFMVFLVSGLWHGAGWTYILWGTINGFFTQLERGKLRDWLTVVAAPVGMLYTHTIWLNTLIVFRAPGLGSLGDIFGGLYAGTGGEKTLDPSWWWVVLAFFLVHGAMYRWEVLERSSKVGTLLFAVLYGLAWALVLPWIAGGYTPFIYFQF